MNADVNILQNDDNSSAVILQGINSGSKRRSNVSEETVTIVSEVIRDTEESSSGNHDEHKVTGVVSENGNENESTPKNPHKELKTQCGMRKITMTCLCGQIANLSSTIVVLISRRIRLY